MALSNKGKISGLTTVSASKVKIKASKQVSNLAISYVVATGQAVATWTFENSHLDHYEARWAYKTATTKGNAVIWATDDYRSTGTTKQSTFTVPEEATVVYCYVKPVAKKDKLYKWQTKKKQKDSKGKWYYQWTQHSEYIARWKGSATSDNAATSASDVPTAPSAPTLTAGSGNSVTVGLSSDPGDALVVELYQHTDGEWVAHGGGKLVNTYKSGEVTAANAFTAAPGHSYKLDARQRNTVTGALSDWSGWSEEWKAVPLTPGGLDVASISGTAFMASWAKQGYTGDGYELRWAASPTDMLVDDPPDTVSRATTNGATTYTAQISAGEWYFAVRATATGGNSEWSEIKKFTIGTDASAPTIGALPAYAAIGDSIDISWTYNNADGSVQAAYAVEVSVDGGAWASVASGSTSASTATYSTVSLSGGETLQFRVKAKGPVGSFSEWAYSTEVGIDAPLTVTLAVGDASVLPLSMTFSATADVRLWHVLVTTAESSVAMGEDGNDNVIPAGAIAFEGVYQMGDEGFDPQGLTIDLDLSQAELVPGVAYTAELSAISPHGLTDSDTASFTPSWSGDGPEPTAVIPEVGDDYVAHVFPVCYDESEGAEEGDLRDDVTLSVYRIDTDGTALEIATGIPNDGNAEVIDPHPNFGECWYRIGAVSTAGLMGFYDVSVEVPCDSVVIQFSDGTRVYTDELEDDGTIEMPYDIEITESYAPDAELAEFIGNADPTLYTGTQLGRKASTSSRVLRSEDADVIRKVRWLAGNRAQAYYRDPSGLGFWAWVVPSLRWKAGDPVSVSLEVTRITGDYEGSVL